MRAGVTPLPGSPTNPASFENGSLVLRGVSTTATAAPAAQEYSPGQRLRVGEAAAGATAPGGERGPVEGNGAEELWEELQHVEMAMVDKIMQEVQERADPMSFDRITGLEFA